MEKIQEFYDPIHGLSAFLCKGPGKKYPYILLVQDRDGSTIMARDFLTEGSANQYISAMRIPGDKFICCFLAVSDSVEY